SWSHDTRGVFGAGSACRADRSDVAAGQQTADPPPLLRIAHQAPDRLPRPTPLSAARAVVHVGERGGRLIAAALRPLRANERAVGETAAAGPPVAGRKRRSVR